MSGPTTPHLVERAAALLRSEAGLITPDPAETAAYLPPPPPPPPAPPPAPARPALPHPGFAAAPDGAAAPGADMPLPPSADAAGPAPLTEDSGPIVLSIAVLQRAGLVVGAGRSRVSEEYRVTVGRIMRTLRGSRSGRAGAANLLLVTSARPGEGKSFSALNLAASIAQNGLADVLLVDVDGTRRSLSAQFGILGRLGLLDVAADGSLPIEPMVVRTAIEGLTMLPIGTGHPGVEGGVTRAVSSAVERIGRRFSRHIVVLDTPPCLSTSDPSTLAPLVDQVVMVVEAEKTPRSELETSLELIKVCPNITLVLNKIRLTQRNSFGAYYHFGEAG